MWALFAQEGFLVNAHIVRVFAFCVHVSVTQKTQLQPNVVKDIHKP